MNIGVIGLGAIGERHVKNLRALYPRASIEVLTKRVSGPQDKKIRLIKSPAKFYATKHDVYFVTNETAKHTSTILKCLKQKPKGIFVEKPLSHSLKGLTRVEAIAKKQGTVVFVGYTLHFFKPLMEIKKLLQKKTVGNILSMRVSVGQDLRAWRKTDYRKSYSADPKRGGGVILDLVHDFNYPAWLLDEPLQLIAGVSGRISKLAIKTEDVAESVYISKKGTLVSVHQDYLQVPGRRYCEIVGEKGTIFWEWVTGQKVDFTITVRSYVGEKKVTVKDRDRNQMYIRAVGDFMRHVASKDKYTNLTEAITDMRHAVQLQKMHL